MNLHSFEVLQRFDEAEPLLREAVAGFREVLGEEHPDTLVAEANLEALLQVPKRVLKAVLMAGEGGVGRRDVEELLVMPYESQVKLKFI